MSLQVRCAAVFALGTFVGNSAERTDHSTTIDHNVAMMLAQLINDGSPVVRKVLSYLNHNNTNKDKTECTWSLYTKFRNRIKSFGQVHTVNLIQIVRLCLDLFTHLKEIL